MDDNICNEAGGGVMAIKMKDMIIIGFFALLIYSSGAIFMEFVDSKFDIAYYTVGGAFGMMAGFYMGIAMMEAKWKSHQKR